MGWNDRFLIDLVEAIKLNVSERVERYALYDELIALITNNDVDIDPAAARGIDTVYDSVCTGLIDEEIEEDVSSYIDEEDDIWDEQDRDRF